MKKELKEVDELNYLSFINAQLIIMMGQENKRSDQISFFFLLTY